MQIELKDLIAWAVLLVGAVAQFFHLKGRIMVLESRQDDFRETIKDNFDKLGKQLAQIDAKLDKKADK
jgi:hypothetical protein